jgi:hypothetical protein
MTKAKKQFVLFETNKSTKICQSNVLTERDFEGFKYDRDHNDHIEVWIKK